MDYNVRDSSVHQNKDAFSEHNRRDNAIRVGIVREERQTSTGETRYVVEVFLGGNQIPVSCQAMTRFGGPYNYEEFRLKPWLRIATGGQLLPSTASNYDLRDGDVVVVAFLDGKAREGIILGSLRHPKRPEETTAGELSYVSMYNGLEKKVDKEGAYTVTFNGAPTNDSITVPPGTDVSVTDPLYNPDIAGSFYGFDSAGGFTVSDGVFNSIVVTKSKASPEIVITSGQNVISMAGNPAVGEMSITTSTLAAEALSTSFKSTKDFKVETLDMKLKGVKVAIGNDSFELIDGLISILNAIGKISVISPVGNCTPVAADSGGVWASEIIPIIVKLQALKGSL